MHCFVCFLAQHYQNDADGLCTRLKTPLKKKGKLDFSVDSESFEKGLCVTKINRKCCLFVEDSVAVQSVSLEVEAAAVHLIYSMID